MGKKPLQQRWTGQEVMPVGGLQSHWLQQSFVMFCYSDENTNVHNILRVHFLDVKTILHDSFFLNA